MVKESRRQSANEWIDSHVILEAKALIVLLNNTGAASLNNIRRAITGILYDRPYDLPKKSIALAVLDEIRQNGLESGLKKCNDLKTNNKDTYALMEEEMNNVGYRLLGEKKVMEAIEIFKLNVDAFPKSSNVYDSLGEAYMVNRDKELAIKNYLKSVELDPGNTNGIEALKKLQTK